MMGAQVPLGPEARIVIRKYGDDTVMYLNNGHDGEVALARMADADYHQFRWLASSAATFHSIPLEEELA
jgi:type 1 glutamine amidotransferase